MRDRAILPGKGQDTGVGSGSYRSSRGEDRSCHPRVAQAAGECRPTGLRRWSKMKPLQAKMAARPHTRRVLERNLAKGSWVDLSS